MPCAAKNSIGSLEPGKQADLAVFEVEDYREIPYYFGMNRCWMTIKRGEIIFMNDETDFFQPSSDGAQPMNRLIECVPNFSEGRDPAKVDAIVQAMSSVPGVYVLDREMDADHNRCVITLAGEPEAVGEAAILGAGKALELIDMNDAHRSASPRRRHRRDPIHSHRRRHPGRLCRAWLAASATKSGSAIASPSFSMKPPPLAPIASISKMFAAASSKACAKN